MRFCDCSRKHADPVYEGMGGMLNCSLCNGFLLCDFCKGAELDSPFMSIARYTIAESYACWHHAWRGIAIPLKVKILH